MLNFTRGLLILSEVACKYSTVVTLLGFLSLQMLFSSAYEGLVYIHCTTILKVLDFHTENFRTIYDLGMLDKCEENNMFQ